MAQNAVTVELGQSESQAASNVLVSPSVEVLIASDEWYVLMTRRLHAKILTFISFLLFSPLFEQMTFVPVHKLFSELQPISKIVCHGVGGGGGCSGGEKLLGPA